MDRIRVVGPVDFGNHGEVWVGQEQPISRPKQRRGGKGKNNRPAVNTKKYTIKVSDFVPMAETIAKTRSDAMVPVALSRLFNRAIQTRRKVSNWFKFKMEPEGESNKRHHYFITILEDAFRILRPFISVGPGVALSDRTPEADETPTPLSLENRFANLTVEDIAEIADQEQADESNLPQVGKVELEQDDSEKEEELWFAVGVFLQEPQTLREVACENWKKFHDGEIDLIAAAMVTDTAIKLAQKAEAEFDLVIERPKKYPTHIYPVWSLLSEIAKSSADGEATYDEEDRRSDFLATHASLQIHIDKVRKGGKNVPVIIPKDLGDDVHKYTLEP